MSLDHRLINLLVCPVCKGPLSLSRDAHQRPNELQCAADRLGFPIRDGIPIMLEAEARQLPAEEPEIDHHAALAANAVNAPGASPEADSARSADTPK